jgi:hypothetical protein
MNSGTVTSLGSEIVVEDVVEDSVPGKQTMSCAHSRDSRAVNSFSAIVLSMMTFAL